jgi:hypothetical protein
MAQLTMNDEAQIDRLCGSMAQAFDRERADPRIAIIAVEMWLSGLLDMMQCPGCRRLAYERLTETLAEAMARHGDSRKHLH